MTDVEAARADLEDPDPRRRVEALRTLGAHGGPAAIDDILDLAADADGFVRGTVCEALGKVGEGVEAEVLLPFLTDDEPRTRWLAIGALERCGQRRAEREVAGMLDDPHPVVRSQAAETLGAWKARAALPAVERRLTLEAEAEVRGYLLYARLRLPESERAWARLADEDWETQHCVLRRFGHTGISGGADRIGRWLGSPHAGVRQAAASALRWCDPPGRAVLLACLEQGSSGVRDAVIDVLQNHAIEDLFRSARRILTDPSPNVRVAAIRYLGRHGGTEDSALIRRTCLGRPGPETDAARVAIGRIEGTAPPVRADWIPGGDAAGQLAARLSASGRPGDRVRAGTIRIAAGDVGPRESLAVLDRAWSRGAPEAAEVAVALAVALAPGDGAALSREVRSGPIATWEALGRVMSDVGMRWEGPVEGRLDCPLDAGSAVQPRKLLLGLAGSSSPRAPILEDGILTATSVWRAVEHYQDRLVAWLDRSG